MFLFHRSVVEKWDLLLPVITLYAIIFDLHLTNARILPSMRKTNNTGCADEKSNNYKSVVYRVGKGISEVNHLSYIEFVATGTMANGSNTSKNSTISKRLPGTTKETPQIIIRNNRWAIKIYGDGIEHKFPPFLERIIQRVQTYFSIYKYTDTSSLETTAENASESNIGAETNFTSILVEDKNNYNVNLFAIDENSSKESPTFVELQTATKEDIDDYTEFIAINENDEDLKFLRNG
ncbi:uncharacterized protein LOC105664760 [Ceratitis capitata]|uniref:uncharacterized protein LOC105664760 n=1 Tax=Ceratitis capitata TaxID=7213 RepID=UPI0006189614|nr:uncharacterized protein LOC105664760 [Ceratitis capitata]